MSDIGDQIERGSSGPEFTWGNLKLQYDCLQAAGEISRLKLRVEQLEAILGEMLAAAVEEDSGIARSGSGAGERISGEAWYTSKCWLCGRMHTNHSYDEPHKADCPVPRAAALIRQKESKVIDCPGPPPPASQIDKTGWVDCDE